MRGLGIGVVVTALILSIINMTSGKRTMTDAEVRERAMQLGMVNGNSYSLTDAIKDQGDVTVSDGDNNEKPSIENADDVKQQENLDNNKADETVDDNAQTEGMDDNQESLLPSETQKEELPEVSDEKTEVSVDNSDINESQPSGDKNEVDRQGETKIDETKIDETSSDADKKQFEDETSDTKNEIPIADGTDVTITVNAGNGSETVAARIKDAGLILDANDFNAYMCRNGYDRKIRVGVHKIPLGSTYEEICKIIAG